MIQLIPAVKGGVAAGVIASLSISNNCAVQNVPYNQVTNTLALSGQTY